MKLRYLLFLILTNCAVNLHSRAPNIWIQYPSQTGVFDFMKPVQVPNKIVFQAIECAQEQLANHNIPISTLPKIYSVYSVNNYFACDGQPGALSNSPCNGTTTFVDAPIYIETWINRNRDFLNGKFCWADTSLVHEILHVLLADTDEGHERKGVWSDVDPNSVVNLANKDLRKLICK